MSTCRHCYATIRFVTLDSGKPIPVEPHPFSDRGNVAARPQGATLVGYVISREKPLRDGYHTYVPHRARCKPDQPKVTGSQRHPNLFDD